MAEHPGAAMPSFRELWLRRSRHIVVWTFAGLLLIVLAGGGIWLAHKKLSKSAWLVAVGFASAAILGGAVLWKVPQWQVAGVEGLEPKERFDRQNEARKTLATILGGAALLAGGFFTWQNIKVQQESLEISRKSSEENLRIAQQSLEQSKKSSEQNLLNAQKSFEASQTSAERNTRIAQDSLKASQESSEKTLGVAREAQISDRFNKAVEQLGALDANGKQKMEVRLGGIYSLEAIANESKDLHWPIMEALCSYVRINAPVAREQAGPNPDVAQRTPPTEAAATQGLSPGIDIQTILTVIGRRNRKYEERNRHLDLSKTDLRGAYLPHADLGGANLSEADLRGAFLLGASFQAATIANANLEGTVLFRVDLSRAFLREADLGGADLSEANLSEADLSGAHLRSAKLFLADLSPARNLTQAQVNVAYGSAATKLPASLCLPRFWARVTAGTPGVCPGP